VALSELKQVNAMIGLSKNIPGWPTTLADHKYTLARIELKLTVSDLALPGSSKVVNPDLLFVSDERNYSLLVELKSGSYHEHDLEQSENMTAVTPLELVRGGRVTLLVPANLLEHKISSMLIVNQENVAAFENALAAANCAICLVSISRTLIQTKRGTLIDDQLDSVFKRGISIDKHYLPSRLVRVLPTTNETKDLKRCVVETVREFWVNSERVINPSIVGQRLFSGGIWQLFDTQAQNQFLDIAKRVLKDMHETEFNRYLQRVPGSMVDWNLLRLPDSEGKNRLKAIQTFQRIMREYKERLLHDVDYPGRQKDQMTLDDVVKNFIPEKV
jgi:hypothetical protein